MVDMQLYFLSPIILYPLWRIRKRVALVVPTIFIIASISVILVFAAFLLMKFRVSDLSSTSPLKNGMIYTMTLSRIDSWMMGILVGYIIHAIEGKIGEIKTRFVILGWVSCVASMLSVIFAQYPLIQENFEDFPLLADATYDSLKRIVWCLAIGWIILACHLNCGNIVKRFLSLSVWLPISKLSFCIYLTHIPVIFIYLSSMRAPQYFSHFRAILKFFGNFGVTFFLAFAWALVFEFPTLTIIASLLSKRKIERENRST